MPFITHANRVEYEENGVVLAEVDFPSVDENTVDISHTFVDASLRGQGIAGKLMEQVVSSLRETGRKAYLSCSYAVYWFDEHPEHEDILARNGE